MKSILSSISLFVLTILLFSCSIITGSNNELELSFEPEYFISNDKVIETFRSHNFISVLLRDDIDADSFIEYLDTTGLHLVQKFRHTKPSYLNQSQKEGQLPIILKLPENIDRNQYYSFSTSLSNDSFASNPYIVYSLPAYSRDRGEHNWYYPNNRIAVKPTSDNFSIDHLTEQFNIEFVSKNTQIDLYTFVDNNFKNGSPYELANKIFESGEFKYVMPNGFSEIDRH